MITDTPANAPLWLELVFFPSALVAAAALLSATRIRSPPAEMLFCLVLSILTLVVPPMTETPTAIFPAFASAFTSDLITDFAVISMFLVDLKSLFFTRTAEETFATLTATPMPTLFVLMVRSFIEDKVIVSAVKLQSSISMMVSIFFTFARYPSISSILSLTDDHTPESLVSASTSFPADALSAAEDALFVAVMVISDPLSLSSVSPLATIVIFFMPTYVVSESYTFLTTFRNTSPAVAEPVS